MARFDRCHTDTSAVFVPSRHSACNSLRQQNGSIHGIPWSRKAPAQSRPLPAPSGFGSASATALATPVYHPARKQSPATGREAPRNSTAVTRTKPTTAIPVPCRHPLSKAPATGRRQRSRNFTRYDVPRNRLPPRAQNGKTKGAAQRHPSVNSGNARPCQSKKLSSSAIPGSVGRSAGSISSSQS